MGLQDDLLDIVENYVGTLNQPEQTVVLSDQLDLNGYPCGAIIFVQCPERTKRLLEALEKLDHAPAH